MGGGIGKAERIEQQSVQVPLFLDRCATAY